MNVRPARPIIHALVAATLFLAWPLVADDASRARLAVDQPATAARLAPGDRHEYRFSIAAADRYRIASKGITRVKLSLSGPNDGAKEIKFGGVGAWKTTPDLVNTHLTADLTAGDYILRVESAAPGGSGEYGIRIVRAHAGAGGTVLTADTKISPGSPGGSDGTNSADFTIDRKATKIALLVGINQYLNNVLAPNLAGCENDADDMQDLLVGSYQFPRGNVRVLKSREATRRNIIAAFREHLIAGAKCAKEAGAESICCVFHYSGHGGRMVDAAPYKDEADDIDETLVPHDSGTAGVFDITDDEIFLLSSELAKYSRNVTFVFDSCHSGNLMKGVGRRRMVVPLAKSLPRPFYDDPGVSLGEPPPPDFNDLRDSRNYVFIAGSQEEQSSYEIERDGQSRGSLTYFLTRAIRAARPAAGSQVTYRAVMEQVKPAVNGEYASQTPYISGEKLDDAVFGDQTFLPSDFVYATLADGSFELKAGQAHGVTVDSRFDVYPPGTLDFGDPGQAVARVKVRSADASKSSADLVERVRPDKLVLQTPAVDFRAVERLHVYGETKIPVTVVESQTPALKRIRELLGASQEFQGYFRFVESGPARLVFEEQNGQIQLTRGGEQDPFFRIEVASPDMLRKVGEQVYAWSRWDNVRQITNPNSRLNVEFTLTREPGDLAPPASSGNVGLRLYHGRRFDLKIVNRSDRPLYMYLLDITSDGRVTCPLNNETLAAGVPFERKLKAEIPAGHPSDSFHEMLKLLVTDHKIDVTPLLMRGAKGRGDAHPLARLLHRAGLSSKDVVSVEPGEWLTQSHELEVIRAPAGGGGATRAVAPRSVIAGATVGEGESDERAADNSLGQLAIAPSTVPQIVLRKPDGFYRDVALDWPESERHQNRLLWATLRGLRF